MSSAGKWLFRIFVGPLDPGFFKTKKPPEEKPKDFEAPEIKIGTPIGVLFGEKRIEPMLVYWGNVKILKQKVDSSAKK